VFTTVRGVFVLVLLVLPGFITARISTGRQAQKSVVGELELGLRALGYSILIQLVLALTGWTHNLLEKTDNGHNWSPHVAAITAFAAAVFWSAVILGTLLWYALPWLARSDDPVATIAFHALGGEDARDAYDYIFERRKRENTDFMVVVQTTPRGPGDDGLRAGLYGRRSYFGLSPRPHDLYLEQMWDLTPEGPRRREPLEEGWFPADSIKAIDFREIPKEEQKAGRARPFSVGIRQAAREMQRDRVRQLVQAAMSAGQTAPTNKDLVADADSAIEGVSKIEEWGDIAPVRDLLVKFGATILRLLLEEEDFQDIDSRGVEMNIIFEAGKVGGVTWPHELWELVVKFHVDRVAQKTAKARDVELVRLAALVVEELIHLDDLDPHDFGAPYPDEGMSVQ
jgi:hypothetical protein